MIILNFKRIFVLKLKDMVVLRNISVYNEDKEIFEYIIKLYPNLNVEKVKNQISKFLNFNYEFLSINENDICSYKTRKDVEENIKESYDFYFLSDFIDFSQKIKNFVNDSIVIKIKYDDFYDLKNVLKIKYNTNKYEHDLTIHYEKLITKYLIINEFYCSDILYGNLIEKIKNNYKIIDSDVFIRNEKINNLLKSELK